jgi:hypothetical protein
VHVPIKNDEDTVSFLGSERSYPHIPSPSRVYVSTLLRIQTAFENAGVLFIDDDETAGIGVRLV